MADNTLEYYKNKYPDVLFGENKVSCNNENLFLPYWLNDRKINTFELVNIDDKAESYYDKIHSITKVVNELTDMIMALMIDPRDIKAIELGVTLKKIDEDLD